LPACPPARLPARPPACLPACLPACRRPQVKSLLLIQSLKQHDESLSWLIDSYTEGKLGTEVQSIEVVWNGKVEQRFFHVPEVCRFLGVETRSNLMLTINRENYDLKMQDFTTRAKTILCEIEHLQVLEEKGVSTVFNRHVQDNMTWFTFFVNLGINFGYIYTYEWKQQTMHNVSTFDTADGSPHVESIQTISVRNGDSGFPWDTLDHQTKQYMQVLNVIQCLSCSWTFILYTVVRAPVAWRVALRETRSNFRGFLAVCCDFYLIYYAVYVVAAM
jgi:hypothetical protein